MILNGLPWKRTEIILSFLRLHPSTGFRTLFKKIRDTKGIFHAKMGSIKDRNGMDLTEAEDIKKRWQEIHRRTVQKRSSRPR